MTPECPHQPSRAMTQKERRTNFLARMFWMIVPAGLCGLTICVEMSLNATAAAAPSAGLAYVQKSETDIVSLPSFSLPYTPMRKSQVEAYQGLWDHTLAEWWKNRYPTPWAKKCDHGSDAALLKTSPNPDFYLLNCFIIPVSRGATVGALSLGEILPISMTEVSFGSAEKKDNVTIGSLTVYACLGKNRCGPETIRDLEMNKADWFWLASLTEHFRRLSLKDAREG